MDVLLHNRATVAEYSEDTAHTIEVVREENENREFGSFGFTLLYEKPPQVGTIVPGGPAEKAGLNKNDVVLTVNGKDVTRLPHQNVVSLISQTQTPGVWLKVCDPEQKNSLPSYPPMSSGVGRNIQYSIMSQSTPSFSRGGMGSGSKRRVGIVGSGGGGGGGALYIDDSPPKYSEVPTGRGRSGGGMAPLVNLSGRNQVMAVSMQNMPQIKRQVQHQSLRSSSQRQLYNGIGPTHSHHPHHRSPPQPSSNCFTSAAVMVLYIGPVEIPDTWSMRGISSKCIQECTRRLLSQRQEFIEAFLEVSTTSMKVLNVSRNILYKHKREELYYCGTCTDDEQYFAIVTRKLDAKLVDPEVGQTLHVPAEKPIKAHICHVFQVIRNKSVLVLHGGDKAGKGEQPAIKPKTIPIMSCLTIIKAIEGLFIGEATGGTISSSQLFSESNMMSTSNTSFQSTGSSGSNGSGDSLSIYGSSPDKSKKKKDVVDLQPNAFSPSQSSSQYGSYVTHEPLSKSREFLILGTQAANSNSPMKWYKTDSPKETVHVRHGSYDSGRPSSGGFGDWRYEGERRVRLEKVKVSDESSLSSLSDRTPSPSKTFREYQGRPSRSPSPYKSLSYSSGSHSRSPSPSRKVSHHQHQKKPSPSRRLQKPVIPHGRHSTPARPTPSNLSASLALEVASRNGAISPTSTVSSMRGYRATLRRQGSESSIMDLQQDLIRCALPTKPSLLSTSHGSMATITTMGNEEGEGGEEEVGRVGGWITSIDKLLADPLGVLCLQQFLEKEHCEENILFWKDGKDFEEKAPTMTNVQIQAASKKIYDEYLSPSSPHTVNVDDRALKAVESRLANPPPNIFAEALEQIYQLLKMDCFMRFKKSNLVKECLLAEMEGKPLPIGPAPQQLSRQNPWKKQKEFGFGRSLLIRLGRSSRVTPPTPSQLQVPGKHTPTPPTKTKKDSKAGMKERESPPSRKTSRDTRQENRRSAAELGTPTEEFPPDKHLDILQAHKGNIFEVNLPNKVTKIMEVPKKGSVRDAISPVLKKYSYSLDMMGLKFADTLKTVDLESPASILIGKHIIVLKSANTFTIVFPDGPERILAAGHRPVRELIAEVLQDMNKLQKFAVYLENSRVSFDDGIEASTLEGQRVTVKYLGGPYEPPAKEDPSNSMDDLFSFIHRLASDTLEDQRTSPTPRNTPEPSSPANSDVQPSPSPQGNLRAPRLSPRSSDSSPETRSKLSSRRRASSTHEKKSYSSNRVAKRVAPAAPNQRVGKLTAEEGKRGLAIKRTQSGGTVQRTPNIVHDSLTRSLTPPGSSSSNLHRTSLSPPPPASNPPPLPSSTFLPLPNNTSRPSSSNRRQSEDYLSTRQRNEEYVHNDYLSHSQGSQGLTYFPRAYPAGLEHSSLYSAHLSGSYPDRFDSRLSASAGQRMLSGGRPIMHRSPSSEQAHPLDNFVNEANVSLPSVANYGTGGSSHTRQQSLPDTGTVGSTERGGPVSRQPWPQHQRSRYSPRPQPPQQLQLQQHRTAAQRHSLTKNPELIQASDQLHHREMEEYQHHQQLTSSFSSSDGGSEPRAPLSPTTHMLILPEDDGIEGGRRETFV